VISFDIGGIRLVPDDPHRREGPNALVIHGGPGSYHSGFKPGYAADARDAARLFRPPRPGRSARDGDPARWTLDENVEDMEVLRRHFGLWPIVSISTSSGGMVGMVLAAHSPDAVSHLIRVATAAHGGFIRRCARDPGRAWPPEQQQITAALWDDGFGSEDDVQHFHTVMGPLDSRRFDLEKARPALARLACPLGPRNRAFGSDGSLHHFDLVRNSPESPLWP
jgi:proline iminopeptidase